MKTQTLDARIRDKARNELRKAITKELEPIFYRIARLEDRYAPFVFGNSTPPTKVQINLYSHMETIRDILIAKQAPKVEDDAVEAFILKVDSLQQQIDALDVR